MDLQTWFPDEDRQAVEAAVREAERRTGSEIVVTVVGACDEYQHAAWKGAALGGLFGSLAGAATIALLAWRCELWGPAWTWMLLPAPTGASIAWLLARVPALRRFLCSPELLDARVADRAARAFLAGAVFRARDRRGVLIFLGAFERRVLVLPDRGAAATVDAAAWSAVADGVSASLRREANASRPGPALIEAVRRSGDLLAPSLPAGGTDGPNELADRPRVEER